MDSEQIGFLVLVIIVVGQFAYMIYRGTREVRPVQWNPFDGWDSSDDGSEHHGTGYSQEGGVDDEEPMQTRGRQEMSPSPSCMFSDAVYLFAKTFPSAPDWGRYQYEELPDGTWVNQSALAVRVVLAAFAYLYRKQLIAIDLGERKELFRKKKTATVKTLQSSAPELSGLEAVLFRSIRDKSDVYGLTGRAIGIPSYNPWRDVLAIVKWNLLQRGTVKQVARDGLFLRTHQYVVNGDISKDIAKAAKQIAELKKTLKELQAQGELYQQMLSDIEEGISSRLDTGD